MSTSNGEFEAGDQERRQSPTQRAGAPSEARGDAWRVIQSDGSRTTAAGRSDEISAAHIATSTDYLAAAGSAARSLTTGDDGEALETLADFLQDEDLTLLDLDLLSCDLSLLSAGMVPAIGGPDTETSPPGIAEESARLDQDLIQVIQAWPDLSDDLRRAIFWIAKGDRQAAGNGS